MTKTYTVAFQQKDGKWITNWHKFFSLDDIDWEEVKKFSLEHDHLAYGYYYGHNSSALTSARCRTVLKTFNKIENDEIIQAILKEKNTHFIGKNLI